MANLTPTATLDNVPEVSTAALVLGGPGGPDNMQAQALLNRDAYILAQLANYVLASSIGTAAALDADTDGTLTANSDLLIATQKAVKTYVDTLTAAAQAAAEAYADGLVTGLWDDRGTYDASTNLFPASGGSGAAGAIMKGDIWTISVAGTLGGSAVEIGDTVRALVDAPAQTAANWAIGQNNIGYVPLNKASNLSDLANIATAVANLGLTIGTNVQAYSAQLAAIAALSPSNDDIIQRKAGAWTNRTMAQLVTDLLAASLATSLIGTGLTANEVAFRNVPQNSQSAAYTCVAADSGKHIFHPSSDNNARTFTIPANASVAFPIGTAITFVNKINTVTIAINTDTLTFAGSGATGSRALAANGIATAIKIGTTEWLISGTGLS